MSNGIPLVYATGSNRLQSIPRVVIYTNSKAKGNAGERELLGILEQHGLAKRNDQRYIGGVDNPDISFRAGGNRFHVECKRAEKFSAYAAMDQAQHDANGHAIPLVAHRRNRRPWLVVLTLEDFLQLMKGDESA